MAFTDRFAGNPSLINYLTAQLPMLPQNMLTSASEPTQVNIDPTATASIPQPQAPIQVPQGDMNYFPPQPDANRAPVTDRPFALPQQQARVSPSAQPQSASSGGNGMDSFAAFLQGLGRGNGLLSAIGGGLGAVQDQKRENQTVSYLTSAGIPQGEAQLIAQSPQAVVQVLQNMRAGRDPKAMLELQGLQLDNALKTQKFQNSPELPDTVQSLQWRAKAAGLQPGTPEYQKFMATGGDKASLVTINGPNSDKFKEKSDEAAAKRLDDIVVAGQAAPQTMADMQQLLDLGSQIGTGKGAQFIAAVGPWAQTLGVNIDGLSDIQAYEAITSRLAPQMRAVGSGSSSDRDVALFFQSLPNLGNTPGGNEIVANTMKAVAQNKINAAEIAAQAQGGAISWQEADKRIAALPNPYELFKNFMGGKTKPGNADPLGIR